MRFDDMLATVLARPAERQADRIAQWRQLLDLLAQRRPGSNPELAREALARLQMLRRDVPIAIRQETAQSFSGRPIPAPLVVFLSSDVPAVAGVILRHVRLPATEWLTVLPRLSPTGRGILRHRADLGLQVAGALRSFGAADLALGREGTSAAIGHAVEFEAVAAEPTDESVSDPIMVVTTAASTGHVIEHGAGEGQIRALINRIARFRKGREGAPAPIAEERPAESFRFETGVDGIIRWVEGAPRGPLIGETIATPAEGVHGVDGQAPGAFRRRTSFRGARLMIPGASAAAGEWRLAGMPVFATDTGRFRGYRGTARRPRAEERAEPTVVGPNVYGAGFEADSLRQLVHELRTPLNAIGGFAEMIRRQMRGPVSTAYRDRAQAIAEQAGRLLAAVDDLDVAARLETHRLDLQRVDVDLGAMLGLVCANHADMARRRGALLDCGSEPALPPVTGDPAALRRMVSRLIAGAAALAAEGETIRATLARSGGASASLDLAVSRPVRLAEKSEAELLDPGYGPEGDWPDAPLLGLGFSLHLVRRLATAAGGALLVENDRFLLRLPASIVADQADAGA